MMEAVILAGGFGTRLSHIVSDVPKPMASVCNRPFLRFILDDIIEKGVTRIILAVGYKKDCIINFFGKRYRGVEIVYSVEDTPLGTGGALKQALNLCDDKNVFVFNGDTFFDVNLKEMSKNKDKIIIATKRMYNFSRYGTVQISTDNIINNFIEKAPTQAGLINGGVYYVPTNALLHINEKTFSFESDYLENILEEAMLISFENSGYFIDIGVPEDYETAQTSMKNFIKKHKIAFFDRDGTINVDTGYVHKKDEMFFIDGMPSFIKKWRDWGYKIVVVTNQAGIARGYYIESDMHILHTFMNEQLVEYDAHIDAFYFCPHHPDFTGNCHCRKPNPGMIERALFEFDADPQDCILFGDKEWDIEAGKKCGVMASVLVK